jgi:hypothetical protein
MATQFQWIYSSCDSQDYDADTRRAIRAQAMRKAAAARKKSGTWGVNRRQHMVIRYDSGEGERGLAAPRQCSVFRDVDRAGRAASQLGFWFGAPGKSMPLTGFDMLVADAGLNVLDLDELTCISAGQRASLLLSETPTKLATLFARRRESYLFHLPARYDQTTCLQDALCCLAIRAKRFVSPTSQRDPSGELRLYGKALRSLQAAIDDGQSCTQSDVLCAIEILSICEVRPGLSDIAVQTP